LFSGWDWDRRERSSGRGEDRGVGKEAISTRASGPEDKKTATVKPVVIKNQIMVVDLQSVVSSGRRSGDIIWCF